MHDTAQDVTLSRTKQHVDQNHAQDAAVPREQPHAQTAGRERGIRAADDQKHAYINQAVDASTT